jgi:lipase chaperone LimK
MNILPLLSNKKNLLIVSVISLLILSFLYLSPLGFNNENTEQPVLIHDLKGESFTLSAGGVRGVGDIKTSEDILKLKMFKLASIDGDIRFDEDGALIIDRDLRHWIDFYLSAIGELTLAEIRKLMDEKIAQLPQPARDQAEKLLAEYLSYKEALASYEDQFKHLVSTNHIENLQQRHDWQKRLRRESLSSEAVEAFWQLDELVDDYALEQLVINGSDSSQEEKAQQLADLDTALPQELKDFRRDLYVASNLQEKVASSREEGNDDEAIRQLRIEQVGLEATDRLEALEIKQDLWIKRIHDYANEIKVVSAIEGLTEQDKQERIESYQQGNFDKAEQLRLDTALSLIEEK